MIDKIIRQSEQDPAYTSMLFAIKSEMNMRGRRGWPKTNL